MTPWHGNSSIQSEVKIKVSWRNILCFRVGRKFLRHRDGVVTGTCSVCSVLHQALLLIKTKLTG